MPPASTKQRRIQGASRAAQDLFGGFAQVVGVDAALGHQQAGDVVQAVAVVGGPVTGPGEDMPARVEWWLATLGRTVVWARLRVREAGTAEVLDSDGNTLVYDSEDTARAMLMDAEFVALDGLDEDDAAERGFLLAELAPPRGDDDSVLQAGMVQKLGGRGA